MEVPHTTITFTPDQNKNLVLGYNGNKQVESWLQYMQNIVQGTGALISSMDDQLIFLEANMGSSNTPLYDAMLLSPKLTFKNKRLYYRNWFRMEYLSKRKSQLYLEKWRQWQLLLIHGF